MSYMRTTVKAQWQCEVMLHRLTVCARLSLPEIYQGLRVADPAAAKAVAVWVEVHLQSD